MCPWSKAELGWISPTVVATAGVYNVSEAEFNADVYRVDVGYPSNEYLLIENRQPVGFDAAMSQGGLAIWHIDDNAGHNTQGYPGQSGWPANGNHYRVALLQADGDYDMEHGNNRGDSGDVYHAGAVAELDPSSAPTTGPFLNTDAYQGGTLIQTNNRIFNISNSGSSMSFSFEVVGVPLDPPADPTNLVATAVSYDQIDLVWQDNATEESGTVVEQSTDGVTFGEVATVGADVESYSVAGLSPSSTLWYRVHAYNTSGDSGDSNTDSAVTDPPPPPAAPGSVGATAVSDAEIDVVWSDMSSDEDGFRVERSTDQVTWSSVATLAAGSTSFADNGLGADATYYYTVYAFNGWGESVSSVVSATTDPPPAFVEESADLDVFVSGTVSGTYPDTWSADGAEQTITERESGGRKSKRRSYCEHQWRFSDVRGGIAVTLFADAWAPANSENDNFAFEYSDDGGTSWTTALTVVNGSAPGTMTSGALANDTRGTVYVRVVDTDDTQGNRTLDSVHVDHVMIRTDLDPTDTPPNAPTNLAANALSATEVELTWSDNSVNEIGFEVWRSIDGVNFSSIVTTAIDATVHTDTTTSPNVAYTYQVSAFTLSYEASSDLANATTPDGIGLSSTGRKSKGKIIVDLTWTGGGSTSTVDIWRSLDGGAFQKIVSGVANVGGGSYSDATGFKGGHTLVYQVCSPAAGQASAAVCSNEVTQTF